MAKAKISMDLRRQLASANGCNSGESKFVNCSICGSVGQICWILGNSGKGKGQIVFNGLEIDHLIPESKNGETVISNLQLLCRRCNRSKGNKNG